MDDNTKAEIYRQMIRHEDGLRDQRLGYLLTLNGFLFAALAFAWRRQGDEAVALVLVLAAVGLFVGLSAWSAQAISEAAVSNLRDSAPQHTEVPIMGVTGSNTDPHKISKWLNTYAAS